MAEATGKNGTISFDGRIVSIAKTGGGGGFSAFINQGIQGDRYIVARHLTTVEFREPTNSTAGFIAFDFPGKNPPKGGVFDAAADENAVIFHSPEVEQFQALRNEIVNFLADLR